jgi:hypothetical protein
LCIRGTVISFRDIFVAVSRPLASVALAGAVAFGVRLICGPICSSLPRRLLETSVLLIMFYGALLSAGEQKSLYMDLLRGLRRPYLRPEPT